jgi:hypothetical protein
MDLMVENDSPNGVCYICGYAAKKQEKFIKELFFIYLFIL